MTIYILYLNKVHVGLKLKNILNLGNLLGIASKDPSHFQVYPTWLVLLKSSPPPLKRGHPFFPERFPLLRSGGKCWLRCFPRIGAVRVRRLKNGGQSHSRSQPHPLFNSALLSPTTSLLLRNHPFSHPFLQGHP